MSSAVVPRQDDIHTPSSIDLDESAIISRTSEKLGFSPHKWQAHIARTLLLRRKQVVVSTAATGAGKSLTFWLPILAGETGITFIVVPLTVLGQQMVDGAQKLGISAFNASAETMRDKGALKARFPPLYASVARMTEFFLRIF